MKIATNSLNRHCDPSKSNPKWERDQYDWYVEPRWAIDCLLDTIKYDGTILDPACGMCTILEACLNRGLNAYGSDIVNRGYGTPIFDFLETPFAQGRFDHIITNPPYFSGDGSIRFMDTALTVSNKSVAILVPIPFLASQKRMKWFRELPISHILILSKRPSMPPGALLETGEVVQKGGKEDYCWIIATHGHMGLPLLDWIMPGVPSRI